MNRISDFNYYGKRETIDYDYIEQCIEDKNEKKLLNKVYYEALCEGFKENESVKYMMSAILKQIAKQKELPFSGGMDEKIMISVPSLLLSILHFLYQEEALIDDLKNQLNNVQNPLVDEIEIIYKNALKKLRKKIDDYNDYDKLKEDCKVLNALYESKRKNIENIPSDGVLFIHGFETYKKELKECITNLICYRDSIVKNFDSIYMDPSLLGSFNNNKYMFIIFSKKLESFAYDTADENEIYPLLTYIKETVDSDVSNLYYYKRNEKTNEYNIKYTYSDFLDEAYKFIKKNPQLNFDIIPSGFFDGWNRDDINEFLDMYTDDSKKNFEIVDPKYIFLPSGNKEKGPGINSYTQNIENIKLAIEKKEFYDKNRDMIHTTLLGKNKFKGYIANILKNGHVIFEKYDIINGCLSTRPGAAYIMNIESFNELSKKDIQELRRMTKEQQSDLTSYEKINYICHSGNWTDRLQKYFDSVTGVSEEDINEVVINASDTNIKEKNKIYYKHL